MAYSLDSLSDQVLGSGKGVSTLSLLALRDNLIAALEGDPNAPNLLLAIAARSVAGEVGTYVFATASTVVDTAFGATVAGSGLFPTSAARRVRVDDNGASWDEAVSFTAGDALTGTWRCMGEYDASSIAGNPSQVSISGATLWLRIA